MNQRDTLKANQNNHLEIGGVDCKILSEKFSTPLYVMDQAYIEQNRIQNFLGQKKPKQ